MSFYKWFKSKSDRELQEAVNNDADKGLNERKNKILLKVFRTPFFSLVFGLLSEKSAQRVDRRAKAPFRA